MVEIREMLKRWQKRPLFYCRRICCQRLSRMCTHHIILHEGKVAQSGTLSELGQDNGGGGWSLTLLTEEWTKGC